MGIKGLVGFRFVGIRYRANGYGLIMGIWYKIEG